MSICEAKNFRLLLVNSSMVRWERVRIARSDTLARRDNLAPRVTFARSVNLARRDTLARRHLARSDTLARRDTFKRLMKLYVAKNRLFKTYY